MIVNESLIKEISALPDEYQKEVFDYVLYLKSKGGQSTRETALLSESSLRKDWLLPEEDKAWEDL